MKRDLDEFDDMPNFDSMESLLFAARNYVVPSDDLRPRTLDAVRELVARVSRFRRWRRVALVSFAAWIGCLVVTASAAAMRDSAVGPFGEELQAAAHKAAAASGESLDWALVQAFKGRFVSPNDATGGQ